VSNELLTEIMVWKNEGASTDDVITRLRLRTVPSNYPVHNWIEGKEFVIQWCILDNCILQARMRLK